MEHGDMKQIFDMEWKEMVLRGGCNLGIKLKPHQLDLMAMHAEELVKWNKKFNITSILDPKEMATKHFIDSIAISPHIPENVSVLDIGSGGGFPGFPLRVIRPDLRVVMADSSRKKVSFLNFLIRKSQLESISAVHIRAEDLSKDKGFAGKFDVVTSRAFTALDKFVALALPFLSKDGIILAMKGKTGEEEAMLLSKDNFTTVTTSYPLPLENHCRTIINIRPIAL